MYRNIPILGILCAVTWGAPPWQAGDSSITHVKTGSTPVEALPSQPRSLALPDSTIQNVPLTIPGNVDSTIPDNVGSSLNIPDNVDSSVNNPGNVDSSLIIPGNLDSDKQTVRRVRSDGDMDTLEVEHHSREETTEEIEDLNEEETVETRSEEIVEESPRQGKSEDDDVTDLPVLDKEEDRTVTPEEYFSELEEKPTVKPVYSKSYLQRGNNFINLVSNHVIDHKEKRKFKSKCRCERIWNCPKLQITVPRCPPDYFMCCF